MAPKFFILANRDFCQFCSFRPQRCVHNADNEQNFSVLSRPLNLVIKCPMFIISTHLKSCHFKLPLGGLAGCEGNINKTVRTSLDPPHPSGCWWRGIQKALSKSLFWINIGSSLVSETYRSFFTKHLFKYLYWKEQIYLQKNQESVRVDLG